MPRCPVVDSVRQPHGTVTIISRRRRRLCSGFRLHVVTVPFRVARQQRMSMPHDYITPSMFFLCLQWLVYTTWLCAYGYRHEPSPGGYLRGASPPSSPRRRKSVREKVKQFERIASPERESGNDVSVSDGSTDSTASTPSTPPTTSTSSSSASKYAGRAIFGRDIIYHYQVGAMTLGSVNHARFGQSRSVRSITLASVNDGSVLSIV